MRSPAADTRISPVPQMSAPSPQAVLARAIVARLADPRARRPLIAGVAAVVLTVSAWGVLNATDPARLQASFPA